MIYSISICVLLFRTHVLERTLLTCFCTLYTLSSDQSVWRTHWMLQSEFLVHLYYSSTALVLKYTIHIFHSSTALLLKYSSITHLWGQGEAMEARFPGFLPFLPLFTPLLPAPSHCYGTYQPHIQLLPIHLTATKHLLTQKPYILQSKVQCCSLLTLFSAAM